MAEGIRGVWGFMATLGWLGSMWLARLSQPAADRMIHRQVMARPPRRILELGLGTLVRTERMLLAATRAAGGEVRYVGLDRFEGRSAGDPPGVSLKEAHRRLHALGRVQLVPGNVDTSLARLCNQLGQFDLVIVSSDTDQRHLERAWFFIQRMLAAETTVFCQPSAGASWTILARSRLDELAARPVLRRAG